MSATAHDFLKPASQSGDLGVLSHYRVIEELGHGGMGFVFLAEDMKLKRRVALKVMNQRIASTPHSRRRFVREARAMAAVHHDNVATIFEVGESNQTPFMAMELLSGSTLEAFNKQDRRLSFEQVIDFARQICRGLSAAHQRGIVHRDIKPANIWVETDKQRIKILDFGLALASSPVDQLAGRGAVIGTPGYLSPEQARSDPLDDRSDLYSLGVVLYELCTGRIPLQAKSVPAQLISILAQRPTPIAEINPKIPGPLCELIHTLLHKEPRARPASADAVLRRLAAVEGQCHSKTEVAQAINKLKAGLDEVVQQKQQSIASRPKERKPAVVGPSLPDALSLPDPLSLPVSATPNPVAGRSHVSRSPTQPRYTNAKKKSSSSPRWQTYLPLAVIAALVLIALPVMTFLFGQAGNRNVAVVVTDDGVVPASDYPSPGSVSSGSKSIDETQPGSSDASSQANRRSRPGNSSDPNTQGARNQNPNARNQNPNARNQNPNARNGASGQRRNNRANGQRRNNGEANSTDSAQGSNARGGRQSGAQGFASPSSGSSKNDERGGQRENGSGDADGRYSANRFPMDGASNGAGNRSPSNSPSQGKSASGNQWKVISNRLGRGADAMVQSGTTENFGTSPSIGIRRRGTVETNHVYLRFDLASAEGGHRNAAAAELLLTVVGNERPIGSKIRVYGVNDVGLWPEDKLNWKLSFSNEGLEGLPLLASTTVVEPVNAARQRSIRIRSRKLAEFVAASDSDLVTLVVAGSGQGSEMIRFVSRDATAAASAPRLRFSVPPDSRSRSDRSGQRNQPGNPNQPGSRNQPSGIR